MEKKIFVVMPAYNAGSTVEGVFSRIPKEVDQKIYRYVVVNDGSTDNTSEVLNRLRLKVPNLVVLEHKFNQGYGAAEKTLLNYAVKEDADIAILLHSDGQYSPEKILNLLKPIEDGKASIVQGSRMLNGGALKGGMPFYKFIGNKFLTTIENYAFKMRMAEYHSGFMLYSKKCLKEIPFNKLSNSFDFDLEMILMAKVKGLEIAEVPIPTIYADEVSHLNPIKYGLDVLSVIKEYRNGKYHHI
jgi:glycosyltransferase involved in cell wall biosynthesis